jgi:hypothetical protein
MNYTPDNQFRNGLQPATADTVVQILAANGFIIHASIESSGLQWHKLSR